MSTFREPSEPSQPRTWGFASSHGNPAAEGLTELNAAQQEFCNFWYDEVDHTAHAGMRPEHITPLNEPRFALAVHKLVADSVSIDRLHLHHPVVSRVEVIAQLKKYYLHFPPGVNLSPAEALMRRQEQDAMLEVTHRYREQYSELDIVYALRRAFRERHLPHATRAMFGLLTAYGRAIEREA